MSRPNNYDSITVLEALAVGDQDKPIMTKIFSGEGVQSYSNAKYFLPYQIDVADLFDLSEFFCELEKKIIC